MTFGGVSSETQGVGINNALILQHRRLRVWRGADEVDIRVGTTPGASYQLPVLAETDRWIGPDADSDTLYALRVGAALHLARLPYRSIVQPANSGTSQQLRAVITAGPATGKLWDSDVSGAGSAAAGAELGLTRGSPSARLTFSRSFTLLAKSSAWKSRRGESGVEPGHHPALRVVHRR